MDVNEVFAILLKRIKLSSGGGVTGVKGNKESTYRAENVNLTPENIGALPTTGGKIKGKLTIDADGDGKNQELRVIDNRVDIMKSDKNDDGTGGYPMIMAEGNYESGFINIRCADYRNYAKNIDIKPVEDFSNILIHNSKIFGLVTTLTVDNITVDTYKLDSFGFDLTSSAFRLGKYSNQSMLGKDSYIEIESNDYDQDESEIEIRSNNISIGSKWDTLGQDNINIKNVYDGQKREMWTKIRGGNASGNSGSLILFPENGKNRIHFFGDFLDFYNNDDVLKFRVTNGGCWIRNFVSISSGNGQTNITPTGVISSMGHYDISINNNGNEAILNLDLDRGIFNVWPQASGDEDYQAANLGTGGYKWTNIYATNGTIQTSDRNEKNTIEELDSQRAQALIYGLKPSTYHMNSGTSNRTHWGIISQDIEELFEEIGMTSLDFAGFIKSPKVKVIAKDENGKELKEPIKEAIEGEYNYSLRYDEFIAPIIKVIQTQHEEVETLKQKIEILEQKISALI